MVPWFGHEIAYSNLARTAEKKINFSPLLRVPILSIPYLKGLSVFTLATPKTIVIASGGNLARRGYFYL